MQRGDAAEGAQCVEAGKVELLRAGVVERLAVEKAGLASGGDEFVVKRRFGFIGKVGGRFVPFMGEYGDLVITIRQEMGALEKNAFNPAPAMTARKRQGYPLWRVGRVRGAGAETCGHIDSLVCW